ncbi:MAG: hypothetical protein LBT09_15895 [Planctomycetaceae bacterium]|jgi:rRNA-processing protein FCF1|nr:hypothetical protein [Planctomycetaceae bacterium]
MTNIEQALQSYVILLDTCFAMQPDEAFKLFLKRFETVLRKNPINVPYRTITELSRLQRDATGVDRDRNNVSELARKAHNCIARAQKEGLIRLREDPNKDKIVINDAVIHRVVADVLQRKPVLVLTHDRALRDALKSQTTQKSFPVKNLIVAGLAKDGSIFDWDNRQNQTSISKRPKKPTRSNSINPLHSSAKAFNVETKIVNGYDMPIVPRETLQEGSFLSTKSGDRIRLRKKIASGGEGTVYELDDKNTVCKIYHTEKNNNKLTKGLQGKIELMLTRKIQRDSQICYPIDAVYDILLVPFVGLLCPKL